MVTVQYYLKAASELMLWKTLFVFSLLLYRAGKAYDVVTTEPPSTSANDGDSHRQCTV
jgi:hypothetical protein